MHKKYTISGIVITKNEEKRVARALESLAWCDEIVVVDNGSTDNTLKVVKKYTKNVYIHKEGAFTEVRNFGLQKSTCDWVVYLDADEEVTSELRHEIEQLLKSDTIFSAFAFPRRNMILGRFMKHGGWWPDYVKRMFFRSHLKKWQGKLHEEPIFEGKLGLLVSPAIHYKHPNLSEMVEKTNKWSLVEAKELFDINHPKMSWWRFIRIMFTEFYIRVIKNQGFLDGIEGVIYSFYQVWSRFLTYLKLWELQIQNESRNI